MLLQGKSLRGFYFEFPQDWGLFRISSKILYTVFLTVVISKKMKPRTMIIVFIIKGIV
jgi:hypothetical protein